MSATRATTNYDGDKGPAGSKGISREYLRRASATFFASVLCYMSATACYHYRAIAKTASSETEIGGSNQPGTEYESELVISFFWGLVQENPTIDNCRGQDLYEVTMSTNLGFSLIQIVSLGTVAPVKVKWRCAKPQDNEGDIPAGGIMPPGSTS